MSSDWGDVDLTPPPPPPPRANDTVKRLRSGFSPEQLDAL